jgi:virulence-associated protein VagC
MINEVNDAGEIVIPAELVQAPPHTKIEVDREGEAVVLKPVDKPAEAAKRLSVGSWTMLEGRLMDPTMTFRREDTYGDDGR